MRPVIASPDVLGGDGLTCREPAPPECGGRLTPVGWTGGHRRPMVKAIGSKAAARQTGQTLHGTTKTSTEKEETP